MIRLATQFDIDEIAMLQVKTWQVVYRGHMPDAFLDGLDPSERAAMWSNVIAQPATLVLVAIAGETLVGFCSLLPSRDADASSADGEIAAIYVDPTVWRSGIGTALIDAAVESARRRGFCDVGLWVLISNSSARAFYEVRGFKTDDSTKVDE